VADVIADFAVRIGAIVSPYNAALADAAVNGERFTAMQMANTDAIRAANREAAASFSAVKVAAASVGLAVAASAAESVHWATDFQTQVTRLYTQAGLDAKQLSDAHLTAGGLDKKLLQLGDDAGFAGDQVAEALYNPISAGLGLSKALDIVAESEKAAKLSGADLSATTVALTSVMRGYGDQLSDPTKAMAEINAIVGQGMMRFSDFNASVKAWEPTAATLHIDLKSVGAALDFLTDRGDSATTAGTRLSMMLTMMVGQSKQASKFTSELGLTTTEAMSAQTAFNKVLKDSGLTVSVLADDLRKPDGIFVALSHLRQAMTAKGMSDDAQNSMLVKLFGGAKAFRGVAELTGQLDQLQLKYKQVVDQAGGDAWTSAWGRTSGTLRQQLDVIGARFHNVGIEAGDWMIPKISAGISWLEGHGSTAWHKFFGGLTDTAGTSPGHTGTSPFVTGDLNAHTGTPLANTADTSNWRKAGAVLREVAEDVGTFARQVRDAGAEVGPVLLRIGQSLIQGVGHDVVAGAHALVDIAGPAVKWFADLISGHEGQFTFFVEVVLGGIAAKWAVLTGLKTISAVGDLAAMITGFPVRQTGAIAEGFAAVRTSFSGVAGEAKALGAGVSGAFTSVYRSAGNTTEALGRYVAISTGSVDPAMIASTRAAQALALAQRNLAIETAQATRVEAEAAAERAAFLSRAAASTERMTVATRAAIEAEAAAAQINAEKLGIYATIAEREATAAAVAAEQAAANVAMAEGRMKASTASMAADAEVAGAASAGLMGGLGAGLGIIGGVVTGIALLGTTLLSTSDDARTASASVDQFTTAMIKSRQGLSDMSVDLGQAAVDLKTFDNWVLAPSHATDKFEGKYMTDMVDGLQTLQRVLPSTMDPMSRLGAILGKLNQEYDVGSETLKSYDGALAGLVSSGHADRAAQLIGDIRAVTDEHGKAMINAARDFPQYYAALDKVSAEQALGVGTTNGATTATNGLDDALKKLNDDTARVKAQYQAMTDTISKTSSVDALQRQFNDLNQTLERNAQDFKGSARDITSNSDAAIANRDAIRGMANSILTMHQTEIDATGDIKGANKAMADQVLALEQVAIHAGLSKDQVDDLLKKYGLIPPSVDTKIKLDSSQLDAALDKLGQIQHQSSSGGRFKMIPAFDDGGWVRGAAGAAIPAIVHAGEYVLSAAMLSGRAPIDPRALAALAAPRGGALPAMAGGGGYGGTTIVVPVTVAGALLSTEAAVQQAVITAMTRFGLRNSNTYVPYSAARRRGS
jgi:hypothetical protein